MIRKDGFVKTPEAAATWSEEDRRDLALDPAQDPVLDEALRNFRLTVQAWSDAACHRPRPAFAAAPHRIVWRKATAWALGCVLVVGIAGEGVHVRNQQQELARQAAARAVEQQRQLAAERAREADDLLAKVDSDVSREVPSAMEPLAQLMSDGDGK